ncbi:MAG: S46 family peptidase [Bacteroidales bacterium]|nr:S46 family peptidase [Bacteroidales bacterium]
MKKTLYLSLLFILSINPGSRADEGMWLLSLIQSLNIDTMQAMGFSLNAEDIYSIHKSSMKDAIVIFGDGCTGEMISGDGLLITNHHCGFDIIQSHSTVENNYLEDGFWAMNRDEELPNPGLTVTFLKSMEDVTDAVLANVGEDLTEYQRSTVIEMASDSLVDLATGDSHLNAVVEPLFGGNSYYLFVYEVFQDVRLVGAPPSSIGKFGSDTDNWMWPRHTGDFSIFRVYCNPDGNPAEYHPDNVPLEPGHYLPVSTRGYQNGDFTMVLGYPGGTDRYMTSFEVRELLEITNPNRIKIRGLRQEILWEDMLADEKVYIQYADKYFSGSTNYYKYSIGQNEGLKRLDVYKKKKKEEELFTEWIKENENRQAKYGEALDLIRQSVEQRAPYESALQYTYECLFTSAEILNFAYEASILYISLQTETGNMELIDSLSAELKKTGNAFFKNYNVTTDMKVTPVMLALFYEDVPFEFHPDFFNTVRTKYRNDFGRFSEKMFKTSLFADPDKFAKFIEQPTASALENDLAFQAASSALELYSELYYTLLYYDIDYERGHRLYVEGTMEMNDNKVFYPDANFTIRMTYGTVHDYSPGDAIHYDYYTTLKGVMEKEDSSSLEFAVPDRLKELYNKEDYGGFGMNGTMPVCFITNNDITGGNSGSPVIDGNGNLIGLAFDGNWEAMSSDIIYEAELQRCICVDIRYVLFIIDKYAGASHLIDEMKLIQ